MRVIGKLILEEFCLKHAEVRSQIDAWFSEVEEANWRNPGELKERYPSASMLGGNRVVFNIKGKKYRVLVRISFKNNIVRIEKAGTHKEYSKWHL